MSADGEKSKNLPLMNTDDTDGAGKSEKQKLTTEAHGENHGKDNAG
jgi:hypothetical protein